MQGDYARKLSAEVARLGLSDRVIFLQNVSFNDLPAIYAAADIASYTSRYEGFGLPVVEAISMGTPVIAATGSCLEEAGGEGALYIHPDDVEAYAREALHLLDDRVFYDKTVRKGKQHIRAFSADNFAKATMATYKKALISDLI